MFRPIICAEISRGAVFGFESLQTKGVELLLLLEFEFEFEPLDEFCGVGVRVGVGVGESVGVGRGETTGLVMGVGTSVGVGVGVSVTTGLVIGRVIGDVIGFAKTLPDTHRICMPESTIKPRIANE